MAALKYLLHLISGLSHRQFPLPASFSCIWIILSLFFTLLYFSLLAFKTGYFRQYIVTTLDADSPPLLWGLIWLMSVCHEIKRCLLLGRKVMTNLDSIFKSRDITLPTKVRLVKAVVFPVVMYGCESWTVKKAER